MTLADYRGIKREKGREEPDAAAAAVQHEPEVHGPAAAAPPERPHPGILEYVKIGAALAIMTAIEVAFFYIDLQTTALVTVLILLSGIKFALVVMWFMHLKFDSQVFSTMFVGGLALAFALFIVVIASLGAGLL